MARQGDAPPTALGAAVSAGIRGNIVAHRSEYVRPRHDRRRGCRGDPPLQRRRPRTRPAAPPAAARRRRIWPFVLAVLAVLAAAALVAARISVNYYVITPGDATPVAQYIEVPAADNHPLTGKILLTDVYVSQLNALTYLKYKYFSTDSEVISGPDLLGPTPNNGQFVAQGYLQMAQAQSYATAAALSRLGYAVHADERGRAHLRDRARLSRGQDAAGGPGDHRRERHRRRRRTAPSSARCTGWRPGPASRSASRTPPSTTSAISCPGRPSTSRSRSPRPPRG